MKSSTGPTIVFASRASPLARRQAEEVEQALRRAWPGIRTQTVFISTRGDRSLGQPLPDIGGKGLFTQELEQALREGRADIAVHSLKDLPIEASEHLILGAILRRIDPREALVATRGGRLQDLAQDSVVGTSSTRRQAQVLSLRPDLRVGSIRGNVGTRVRKVMEGAFDATVLAAAGLIRLGLEDKISEWFDITLLLPAPGQGALAVQCRGEDLSTRALLTPLDDPATRTAVTAERAFLHALGGGCSAPVAAYAHLEGSTIHLAGMVANPQGGGMIRVDGTGEDSAALASQLAAVARTRGADRVVQHA